LLTIFGGILTLRKNLGSLIQQASNVVYHSLSPKNRKRVNRAYRGSKRVRGGIKTRAPRGKAELKRMILGGESSFTGALINEPGYKSKKIVVGKKAGKIVVSKKESV